MGDERRSLRRIVETWVTPNGLVPVAVRVARRVGHRRCVEVIGARAAENISLYFFRHDDGAWRVFPQEEASLRFEGA